MSKDYQTYACLLLLVGSCLAQANLFLVNQISVFNTFRLNNQDFVATSMTRIVISPDEKSIYVVGKTFDRLGTELLQIDDESYPFIKRISVETGETLWSHVILDHGSNADVAFTGNASNFRIYVAGDRVDTDANTWTTVIDEVNADNGNCTRVFSESNSQYTEVGSISRDRNGEFYLMTQTGSLGSFKQLLRRLGSEFNETASVVVSESYQKMTPCKAKIALASGVLFGSCVSLEVVPDISIYLNLFAYDTTSGNVTTASKVIGNRFPQVSDGFIDKNGQYNVFVYTNNGLDGALGSENNLFVYHVQVDETLSGDTNAVIFGSVPSPGYYANPTSVTYRRQDGSIYLSYALTAPGVVDSVYRIVEIEANGKKVLATSFNFKNFAFLKDLIYTQKGLFMSVIMQTASVLTGNQVESGSYVFGLSLNSIGPSTTRSARTTTSFNRAIRSISRAPQTLNNQQDNGEAAANSLVTIGVSIGVVFCVLLVGIYACFRYRDYKIAEYQKKVAAEKAEKQQKKEAERKKRRAAREEKKRQAALAAAHAEYDGVQRNSFILPMDNSALPSFNQANGDYMKVGSGGESGTESEVNSQANTSVLSLTTTLVAVERELALPGYLLIPSIQNLNLLKVLAEGGYATVHLAEPNTPELSSRSEGNPVAVKVFKSEMKNASELEGFCQEVSLMHFFRDNKNFVKLVGYGQQPFFIAMKQYTAGSFADLIHTNTTEKWTSALVTRILTGLANALAKMHSHDFVHCDVKVNFLTVSTKFLAWKRFTRKE